MISEDKEMESIWAPGIPKNINPSDRLQPKVVLDLCIRFVLEKILMPKEYEIKGVSNDIKSLPNIVAEKEGTLYAIAVVPAVFPNYSTISDEYRIKFVHDSKTQNSTPIFCPVLIHSTDRDRAAHGVLLSGDLYDLRGLGQLVLTEDEKQDLKLQSLKFNL